jgi:hypothetical protein
MLQDNMTTFQPFPRLPAELLAQIWETTVESRIIDVKVRSTWNTYILQRQKYHHLYSTTPVPAPLQTCREAKNGRLYKRVFSNLVVDDDVPKKSERRYVCLNLDIDMVSIGETKLKAFRSVARLIKQLRLECDVLEYAFLLEEHEMSMFVNVKEIHMVLPEDGDAEHSREFAQRCSWPCGSENISISIRNIFD